MAAADEPADESDVQQTIPVRVQVVFVVDGKQLGAVAVEGELPLPGDQQTAQITIPLDARDFVGHLAQKLLAIEQEKASRRLLVPEHPASLIVPGNPGDGPLVMRRKAHD